MRNDPKKLDTSPDLPTLISPGIAKACVSAIVRRTHAALRAHSRRHAADRELRQLSASLRMDLGLQPDDQTRRFG